MLISLLVLITGCWGNNESGTRTTQQQIVGNNFENMKAELSKTTDEIFDVDEKNNVDFFQSYTIEEEGSIVYLTIKTGNDWGPLSESQKKDFIYTFGRLTQGTAIKYGYDTGKLTILSPVGRKVGQYFLGKVEMY